VSQFHGAVFYTPQVSIGTCSSSDPVDSGKEFPY
jgi:hypothetical protein